MALAIILRASKGDSVPLLVSSLRNVWMRMSLRAHGSHSQLPAIETLDNLYYVRYLALLGRIHCVTEMTYSRNEVIKHLLDVADRRQILAEVFDSVSDLVLHAKRLDARSE